MTEQDLEHIDGAATTPTMQRHGHHLSIRQEFGMRAMAAERTITRQRTFSAPAP